MSTSEVEGAGSRPWVGTTNGSRVMTNDVRDEPSNEVASRDNSSKERVRENMVLRDVTIALPRPLCGGRGSAQRGARRSQAKACRVARCLTERVKAGSQEPFVALEAQGGAGSEIHN